MRLPTHRQHLSLEGLEGKDLKLALDDQVYEIEHLVSDPENWSLDEVEEWLETEIEFDNLGPWQAARLSPYNVGLKIYETTSVEDAGNLGLCLVEGGHPGSSFTGVAFHEKFGRTEPRVRKTRDEHGCDDRLIANYAVGIFCT